MSRVSQEKQQDKGSDSFLWLICHSRYAKWPMILGLPLFLMLFCLACNRSIQKVDKHNFVNFAKINRSGTIQAGFRSTYPNLIIHDDYYASSFDFLYPNGNSYEHEYSFQKNQRCADFYKKDSIFYVVTKVDERLFTIGNDSFNIIKYYYDEAGSWDEEEVILINEKLGILFIHQYWGVTFELMQHPDMNKSTLNELKEKIKEDKAFYRHYNSCVG